jgi:LacI family transcriptional regulator
VSGKSRITLDDIANRLKISKSTVSNALTGNRYVSPRTAFRVREFCRQYGYRGNVLARGLRTQKTNIIGITVPDITEPFYSSLVRQVEEELKTVGYQILLGSYDFNDDEERKIIETFEDMMVDGLIVIAGLNGTDEVYGNLTTRFPVVFLDRKSNDDRVVSVVADHRQIGLDAVNYLVAKGHRNMVHVTIPFRDFRTAELRAQGYRQGLARHGLEDGGSTILIEPTLRLHEIPTSIELAKRISQLEVSAVFAVSDYVAIGLIKGLSALGKRIPEDISILSVTNTNYCLVTSPTLSSFDLSPEDSSRQAVDLMLKSISGVTDKQYSIAMPHRLVERESVRTLSSSGN